jgi:hypothetical protein
MATFERAEDGVWTVTLDETDGADRNAIHDEAVPRYLTTFDPAFDKAAEADEAEFVKALLRIWSVQDAGWDPYETTLRAVPAMQKLHALIPAGDEWSDVSRHLALWTWGHVIEASEPYAMLADLLHIAGGGYFQGNRFPDVPVRRPTAEDPHPPTRPQRFDEKLKELQRLAREADLEAVLAPIDEVRDRILRNAVFHADYTLHGPETRVPSESRTYAPEDIERLVNQGLAYHSALAVLRRSYRLAYEEPTLVTQRWRRSVNGTDEVRIEEEAAVVVVRDGTGAIGLKHNHTAQAIAAGAIPWHIAHLYPDEAAALRADPTLAHFPAREDA